MMNFKLIKQLPKPKEIGIGSIDVSRNGEATFFTNGNLMARMERVRVDWMAGDGFMLSGFEEEGKERSGRIKSFYQQWYLVYPEK